MTGPGDQDSLLKRCFVQRPSDRITHRCSLLLLLLLLLRVCRKRKLALQAPQLELCQRLTQQRLALCLRVQSLDGLRMQDLRGR
jgi:hypothetical protein